MIEFYGEYSETSKKFLLKQNAVLGMIVSLMVALILVTILLFLAIAFKFWMILFFLFPNNWTNDNRRNNVYRTINRDSINQRR